MGFVSWGYIERTSRARAVGRLGVLKLCWVVTFRSGPVPLNVHFTNSPTGKTTSQWTRWGRQSVKSRLFCPAAVFYSVQCFTSFLEFKIVLCLFKLIMKFGRQSGFKSCQEKERWKWWKGFLIPYSYLEVTVWNLSLGHTLDGFLFFFFFWKQFFAAVGDGLIQI